jgi:D-serine deaminase-like pyridoxal phosphate-dependent protein
LLVQALDTPCAVVDLDVMENNLRRCQTYLDRHGLSLRPHNLYDRIYAARQGRVETFYEVAARGKVQ